MLCFGTIPNIPCLVQTGYVVIVISPMVAPFEKRIERVGTSQADDFRNKVIVLYQIFLFQIVNLDKWYLTIIVETGI